jgi:hypothetical protein
MIHKKMKMSGRMAAVVISWNNLVGCSMGHWLGLAVAVELESSLAGVIAISALSAIISNFFFVLLPATSDAKAAK